MTQPLRIGLAGLGTVGMGVLTILTGNGGIIGARAGRPLQVVAVSARDQSRDRGMDLSGFAWETDPVALAQRDDIDVFVEMIGGEDGPALAAVEAALGAGHAVVTANKALLAHHGQRLALLAEQKGAALRYEAAVAGGIPCVKALTEGMAGNAITRVMGVLNGTCNYILTAMEAHGRSYEDALREAQELGYAEADPSFDVGGIDAAHKLALLAATAFGAEVDFDGVTIEGIERIALEDILHAREMGYRIKLLGVAQRTGEQLEQRMQPCLVPATSPIGHLEDVANMVVIEGDAVGQTCYQGPGAGAGPTGSAIVADLIDIARGSQTPAFGIPAASLTRMPRAEDSLAAPFYLRLSLEDRPGALAEVAQAFGQEGVSIDRMQQGRHAAAATVLIVTHACKRAALDKALAAVAALPVSAGAPVALRIESV